MYHRCCNYVALCVTSVYRAISNPCNLTFEVWIVVLFLLDNLPHGCRNSFPVVTLYTNLGEEGVGLGVNETEVDTIITSHELLPKFKTILKTTPSVKQIIYFDNPLRRINTSGFREDVRYRRASIPPHWSLCSFLEINYDKGKEKLMFKM